MKSVRNVLGILHKAMADAVEDGIIAVNPVPRMSRRAIAAQGLRSTADPLTPAELKSVVDATTPWARDLLDFWFRVGWRPSEVFALRFDWIDWERQIIEVRQGRIYLHRTAVVEALPKTGQREVSIAYDQEIIEILRRRLRASLKTGKRDYVFTTPEGNPLLHNRVYKYVWRPALRRAGLRPRGLYTIRDTFISLALSAGEDPGWVAQVAGTSEQMIFRHYRRFMHGAVRHDGSLIAKLLQKKQDPGGRVPKRVPK